MTDAIMVWRITAHLTGLRTSPTGIPLIPDVDFSKSKAMETWEVARYQEAGGRFVMIHSGPLPPEGILFRAANSILVAAGKTAGSAGGMILRPCASA